MVFSSTIFIFLFLPLVLSAYFLSPKLFQNIILLIFSLFFYAWGEAFYVFIMVGSIFINYLGGIMIDRYRGEYQGKLFMVVAVSLNIGILVYFKYANFVVGNINQCLEYINFPIIRMSSVHLPIGISFFTFQAISYIVDVYRGSVEGQRRFINVALYISLFPQLIAGPIVRYTHIATQMVSRNVSFSDFSLGVRRFIIGLGKKVIIANPLGELTDQIMGIPFDGLTPTLAWVGAVSYALQIYFDFSGYSDMAIGLGRMFGFTFPENFRFPYISRSMKEFWTRWHISLSSWFRDYLYVPAGGNRVSPFRTYLNLFMVFFLCGLWHGASWNFVIWGLAHGFFLVLERIGFLKFITGLWKPLQHFYVLFVVTVTWVFFRLESLADAVTYVKTMFGLSMGRATEFNLPLYLDKEKFVVFLLGILCSMPLTDVLKKVNINGGVTKWIFPLSESVVTFLIFIFSLMMIASGTYNPFIYFRF